jgi:hypothetical protein
MSPKRSVLTSVLTKKIARASKRVLTPKRRNRKVNENPAFRPCVLAFRPVKTVLRKQRFDPLRKRKSQNAHGPRSGDPVPWGSTPLQSPDFDDIHITAQNKLRRRSHSNRDEEVVRSGDTAGTGRDNACVSSRLRGRNGFVNRCSAEEGQ